MTMADKSDSTSGLTEGGPGQVRINNDVITVIAARAAAGVDGVAGLVGNVAEGLAHMLGKKSVERGVRVEVEDNVATLELSLICKYGYNIPKVCSEVQFAVKGAVEEMTGLAVSAVNINVQGLQLEEAQGPAPAEGE